ncbi:MAG: hypothetical protein WCP21_12220, partial [Armatimonadota bacterium]
MERIVTGREKDNLWQWNVNHRRSMSPRKRSEPQYPDRTEDVIRSAEDDPPTKKELERRRRETEREAASGACLGTADRTRRGGGPRRATPSN